MNRRFLLLLSLLLTAALLLGCGGPAATAPAPETATPAEAGAADAGSVSADAEDKSEADAPVETPAPTEEPAAADTYPVEGRYFTVSLPAEWEDQITVEERDSGEPYYLRFFHSPCHEGGGGHLFSLFLYPDTKFVSLPSYRLVGVLSDGQTEQYLVMLLPTDVQATLESLDAYFAIYDEDHFLRICQDLEPAEGYTFREGDPAVLRAAQTRFAYANRMSILLGLNKMPDYSEAVPEDWHGDMANNRFAVYDVDGDGEDELLVSIEDAPMAGMRTVIYALSDEGGFATELGIFPSAEYYGQGLIKAYSSHNQTHGVLWPYTLYRYNPAQDIYVEFASVYGWDKDLGTADYNGDPFPDAADLDGNGSVASLQDADGQRWIDDSELAQWEAEQLGGAAQLLIPWQAIIRSNVDALWDTV